ncbi:hypothetical protein JEQ12_019869 [Ovis aries]|uniref:Uncharacterized protein n=1 Tax=Ovis aries TaxID=9940 RepID=A0A836CQ72_SHEEP|nr:hypothetical protein JEQ12_019869 [Ovis aries]
MEVFCELCFCLHGLNAHDSGTSLFVEVTERDSLALEQDSDEGKEDLASHLVWIHPQRRTTARPGSSIARKSTLFLFERAARSFHLSPNQTPRLQCTREGKKKDSETAKERSRGVEMAPQRKRSLSSLFSV